MAERVARHHLSVAGVADVEVTSAATSREELGEPIDPRAARTMRAAGYDPSGHVARQITAAEIDRADLVVAMEHIHVERMRRITGHDLVNVVLFGVFDPTMDDDEGVPDPWYGGQAGFDDVLQTLERGMPAFVEQVQHLLAEPASRGARSERASRTG